jgi:hypothetical protein
MSLQRGFFRLVYLSGASSILGVLLLSSAAIGVTVNLSSVSSDATPSSQLDATVEFEVGEYDLGNAGDELRITLTNPSAGQGGDALFNINQLFFNASSAVTGLSLLDATHSANGDVTGLWDPVETGLTADGFGAFDYALRDGVGEMTPGIVMPGQNVVFLLDISSIGAVTGADFVVANGSGYTVAAKFVNGPDDPEAPGMEDSAFGTIPEPSTAMLLSLGLLALGDRRRVRSG